MPMTKEDLAREPGHTIPVSLFVHRDEWGWERLYVDAGGTVHELPLAPYHTRQSLAHRVADSISADGVRSVLQNELGHLATAIGRLP